jgi:hypothetical protein
MFNRFFNVLKVAFLFPIFGRTLVTLDFAFGIETYNSTVSDLQLFTSFVTSTLLALAFIILYIDWRREPVGGSPQPHEP